LSKQSRTARQGASTPAPRSNPAPPLPAEAAASATEPAARDPAALPASPPSSALCGDPAAVARWREASRAALLDLLAAAREGARRPHKRVLSRAELRRQARDAFAQAAALLDLAAEAMRAGP
jgi:uncharacterized membrane protein